MVANIAFGYDKYKVKWKNPTHFSRKFSWNFN